MTEAWSIFLRKVLSRQTLMLSINWAFERPVLMSASMLRSRNMSTAEGSTASLISTFLSVRADIWNNVWLCSVVCHGLSGGFANRFHSTGVPIECLRDRGETVERGTGLTSRVDRLIKHFKAGRPQENALQGYLALVLSRFTQILESFGIVCDVYVTIKYRWIQCSSDSSDACDYSQSVYRTLVLGVDCTRIIPSLDRCDGHRRHRRHAPNSAWRCTAPDNR